MSDSSPMSSVPLPRGFTAHVANVGIKDDTDDFVVITSEAPCPAAAVFTRSRFAGPSVEVSRRHVADGQLQAVVVVSKNANVATGPDGLADAEELAAGVADAIGCATDDVLVTSTGVIGRRYPIERIRTHLSSLSTPFTILDALPIATGMMTTDTFAKTSSVTVALKGSTDTGGTDNAQLDGDSAAGSASSATVVGMAKGVGMIEPDMATMLAFVLTDALVAPADLDRITRSVVARTFNSLSVDTDTSTSDTFAVLANGCAGEVDLEDLEAAIESVCSDLTRQLARDGEGATTLLLVDVSGARDDDQARRVAKAVVNSPLVKTAVHGADPNWGRVAMAVGKCSDDTDIDQRLVRISFGGTEVYPTLLAETELAQLEDYLRGDEVTIAVDLGIGDGTWRVYGCDLTDGYVRINADYTT